MSLSYIFEYVLEKAELEPCCKRAKIYESLANLVPNGDTAAQLLAISNKLKSVNTETTQLRLNLRTSPNN